MIRRLGDGRVTVNPFIPPTPPTRSTLHSWWCASAHPLVDARLRELHSDCANTVAVARPVCLASGKCCHFGAHGHILAVTGLEALWTWREAGRSLSPHAAVTARNAATCPFLDGTHCSIHSARPTGCRTYFCDRGDGRWQSVLSEKLHSAIIDLHNQHAIPYLYAEWTWLVEHIAHAHATGVLSEPLES